MKAQNAKVKSLQLDMLKEISSMLKIAASLEDDRAGNISDIVYQLEDLVEDIEVRLGHSESKAARQKTHLTLV